MHFDWTISLGHIISAITFVTAGMMAWRDMNWRVKNLEEWRKEHMVDADSRDHLLANIDKILFHITHGREGKR